MGKSSTASGNAVAKQAIDGLRRLRRLIARELLLAVLAGTPVFAHEHPGYSHDSGQKANNEDWMSTVDGTVRLSMLSIPGTHDSMAYVSGGDAVETQSMTLIDQLNSGIRALDIRCFHILDTCDITHGIFRQYANLDNVLDTVTTFLKAHPGEFVLMRMNDGTEAGTPRGNTRSWDETFKWYRSKPAYSQYFWVPGDTNPKLDDVRGKIVLLRKGFNSDAGIPYGTFNKIQDDYTLTTNWDLYSKWEKVREQLDVALHGANSDFYMNYLSGSGGSFPYFVSSGHASHQTGAARLSTGLTTLVAPNTYPDFPRTTCLGSLCTISFEGTNVLTTNWLGEVASVRLGRLGVIMADFPGAGLINAVVGYNPRRGAAGFRNFSTQRDGGADWAPMHGKASCAIGESIVGISVMPVDHQGRTALCRGTTPSMFTGVVTATLVFKNMEMQEMRRAKRVPDWSPGYYKIECGLDEYVAGVTENASQFGGNNRFYGVQCAKGSGLEQKGAVTVRVMETGEARGTTRSGDWDFGAFKGECGDGEVVVGVSVSPDHGGPHALLCAVVMPRIVVRGWGGSTYWGTGALQEFQATTLDACTTPCLGKSSCSGGTFNPAKKWCWLRTGAAGFQSGIPSDEGFLTMYMPMRANRTYGGVDTPSESTESRP
jgi:1-phosphatidylinositol phosphodiesterase